MPKAKTEELLNVNVVYVHKTRLPGELLYVVKPNKELSLAACVTLARNNRRYVRFKSGCLIMTTFAYMTLMLGISCTNNYYATAGVKDVQTHKNKAIAELNKFVKTFSLKMLDEQ